MIKLKTTTAAVLLTAGVAQAGGLDRSGQPVTIIFEDGQYAELSFGFIKPNVSGSIDQLGLESGNMAQDYSQISLGFKRDLNDQISYAMVIDQPYGAAVAYDDTDAGYPLAGAEAEFRSTGVTVLGRYKFDDNFSIHGGLRAVTIGADANIPLFGYDASYDNDTQFGYVIGAAYERTDIALRVALTYSSAMDFSHDTTVNGGEVPKTEYEMAQSVNLDFQTGIAADTLLFGSVRWVEWSATNIDSAGYPLNPIVGHDNDVVTYNVGVGRRFTDQFSGSVSFGYEKSQGGVAANLAPTDGFKSIALGGAYTLDNGIEISGGVRYIMIGDANTEIGALTTTFDDNTATAIGVKIAFNY